MVHPEPHAEAVAITRSESIKREERKVSLVWNALFDLERLPLVVRLLVRQIHLQHRICWHRRRREFERQDGNLEQRCSQCGLLECLHSRYAYLGSISSGGGSAGDNAETRFPASQALVLCVELGELLDRLLLTGVVSFHGRIQHTTGHPMSRPSRR